MTWQDLATHRLVVYSTSWCPDCHRLKRVLRERQVPFDEVDIDADPAAAERLRQRTRRTAIPFVQVAGGPMVRGWHDEAAGRFSEGLFLAEVQEALSAVGNG